MLENNIFYKYIVEECEEVYNEKKFHFLKDKTVLITGATGIVGNYFLAFFLKSLEKKFSPKKIWLIYKSKLPYYLLFLRKNNKFKLIKADLSILEKLKIPKFDYIIHLAGYAQPSKFTKDPLKTFFLNTSTVKFLINKLNKKGIFLNLSSSEIYNGVKGKLTEDKIGNVGINHIRACYIEGKKTSETITNLYKKKFKINAKSIRLCSVYGPGNKKNDGRLIYQLITKGIRKNKIELLSIDKNSRTFLYMLDALKMMINVMFFGKKDLYNIGNPKKISILNLAKKISKIINAKISLPKKNISIGSPNNTIVLDMALYYKEFRKFNLKDLNFGIRKTVEWNKNYKY